MQHSLMPCTFHSSDSIFQQSSRVLSLPWNCIQIFQEPTLINRDKIRDQSATEQKKYINHFWRTKTLTYPLMIFWRKTKSWIVRNENRMWMVLFLSDNENTRCFSRRLWKNQSEIQHWTSMLLFFQCGWVDEKVSFLWPFDWHCLLSFLLKCLARRNQRREKEFLALTKWWKESTLAREFLPHYSLKRNKCSKITNLERLRKMLSTQTLEFFQRISGNQVVLVSSLLFHQWREQIVARFSQGEMGRLQEWTANGNKMVKRNVLKRKEIVKLSKKNQQIFYEISSLLARLFLL